jgi:macrolide transport system ATP-binding/permease protein
MERAAAENPRECWHGTGFGTTAMMMRDLLRDLRLAGRSLRRSPGFTATVVASLALGIAANAAIFTLIDFVFLRPLPVRDPGGLVLFAKGFGAGFNGGPPGPGPISLYPYPLFERLRSHLTSFRGLTAQQSGESVVVVHGEGNSDEAGAALAAGRAVSANSFEVLGVPAFRGRTFIAEDETTPGCCWSS